MNNHLNIDLMIEMSKYFYDYHILALTKIWLLDKSFHPVILYLLRRNRHINDMSFILSHISSTHNGIPNNIKINELKYLQQCDLIISDVNNNFNSIITYLVLNRYDEMAKLLISIQQADSQLNYQRRTSNRTDPNFKQAIFHTVEINNRNMFKLLTQIHFQLKYVNNSRDYVGLMYTLINYNNKHMVKYLANIPIRSRDFTLAIDMALGMKLNDIVKILALSSTNKNFTKLVSNLIQAGNINMAKHLAALSSNKDFSLALVQAVKRGDLKLVQYLIELNNISIKGINLAIYKAIEIGRSDIVRYLQQYTLPS